SRTALEEEKRQITEKTLALEQVRSELTSRSGDGAATERRLERWRRRGRAQNAAASRALARDRKALQAELATLEARSAELERRAADLTVAEADLSKNTTAWEHKQVLTHTRQARLEQELQIALAHRAATEQELAKMRDEVERIASNLLDE